MRCPTGRTGKQHRIKWSRLADCGFSNACSDGFGEMRRDSASLSSRSPLEDASLGMLSMFEQPHGAPSLALFNLQWYGHRRSSGGISDGENR